MKTSEILVKAKAAIDTPEKWVQGATAVDADGCRTSPRVYGACKFCAVGAIAKLNLDIDSSSAAAGILDSCAQKEHFPSVVHYNDAPSTTHPRIMELFDKAITKTLELEQRNENI